MNSIFAGKLARVGLLVMLALGRAAVAQDTTPMDEQTRDFLGAMEHTLQSIAADFNPSIVSIACISKNQRRSLTEIDPIQSQRMSYFQAAPSDPSYIAARYASGIVWDDRGSIVTPYSALGNPNDHEYLVWNKGLLAGAQLVGLQAQVIAGEPYTNLAVLRVGDEKFALNAKPIRDYTFKDAVPGSICVRLTSPGAIYRDGQSAIDWGIVSGVHRSLESNNQEPTEGRPTEGVDRSTIYAHGSLIHTTHVDYLDATGAALFNLQGDFVGITIDSSQMQQQHLPGTFALPANKTLRRIVDALAQGKLPAFSFMGIQPGEVNSIDRRRNIRGVAVEAIIPGMPGESAGVRVGDVITHIDQREVESRNAIFRELAAYAPGDTVQLSLLRPRGNEIIYADASVKLSKRYVVTNRPAFSIEPDTKWRGALIDYITAFPPDLLFQQLRGFNKFSADSIAVIDVDLGSPAWAAGLRTGSQIVAVNGQPATSMEDFLQMVGSEQAGVTLTLQTVDGQQTTVTVKPGSN